MTKIKRQKIILDKYEQSIEDSIPKDFKPIYATKKQIDQFAKIASAHKNYQKSKRVNIRINNADLIAIKAKAQQNNMPYQTLLNALVHKYAKGETKIVL